MLPSQKEIEIPLLEILVEIGGQGRPAKIYPLVRKKFPTIPDQAFTETVASGNTNKWTNKVQWVRHTLVKKGEIDSPARGIWRITKIGRRRLGDVGQDQHLEKYLNGNDIVTGKELQTVARSRKLRYKRQKKVPLDSVSYYKSQGYQIIKEFESSVRMAITKPDDENFEDEIWLLMWKFGFSSLNISRQFWIDTSKPSRKQRPKQIDVFAKDTEGHVFIIECKYSEKATSTRLTSAITDIAHYRSRMVNSVRHYYGDIKVKKLKITFVIATRNIRWSDRDLEDAKSEGIHIWRDSDIDHLYELAKLHSLIGDAARFQLYNTMFKGQEIPALQGHKVAAIKGKAGDHTFYQFVATPKQLLRIAYVHHRRSSSNLSGLGEIGKTYQRILKQSKIREIGDFIDRRNYFPNSIIISFSTTPKFELMPGQKDLAFKAGTLTLPNEYGSAWVIDGQHRLYGFARSTFGLDDPLPVVAFKDLSLSEQSKLFVEINKNQTNVGTNLLWDLYGDIYQGSRDSKQREDLTISNIVKKLDTMKSSPFKGHVYIPSHGRKSPVRNLTMATICQSIRRNRLLDRDLLGRHKLPQKRFEQYAADRIAAFFRSVEKLFREDWEQGEKGYLRTNNGVAAFLIMMKRTLSFMNNEEKSSIYTKAKTDDFEEDVYCLLSPAIDHLKADPNRPSDFRRRSGQAGQSESANELSRIVKNEYLSFFAPPAVTTQEVPVQGTDQIQNVDLDELIKDTELRLRTFIIQNLKELYGGAWYRKGIPGGVKNHIDGMITREIKNFPYKKTELMANFDSRLEYTSLGHLKDIIVYGENWARFESTFRSQQNLENHFGAYNDLRNAYRGHMREVDPVLMNTGQAAIYWIRRCLKL